MLQSMVLQRVGRDLATEQQKQKTREFPGGLVVNIRIDLVNSSLDMSHTGKAWSWVKCTSIKP